MAAASGSVQISMGACRGTAPWTSLNATLACRSQNTGRSTPSRRPTCFTNGPAAFTKRGVAIVRSPPRVPTRHGPARAPRSCRPLSTRPSMSRTPFSRARSRRYIPSCWPLNQPQRRAWSSGHRVLGQVREVPADQRPVRDDVGARRLVLEALGGRRLVVAARIRVHADGAGAERRGFSRALDEERHAVRVGRGEEVAAPVHAEHVAALAREVLQEVDAAVHERRPWHRRARATSCGSTRSTCRWSMTAADARRPA